MARHSTRTPASHTPATKPNALAVAIVLALASPAALALPEDGHIVAGQAAIQRPDAASLNIDQSTAKAVVEWQSFSIGSGEAVRIQQPSASATLLNRVVGDDPSRIFGQLSANGQVFLVNPAGILFAPGARLDVGSLTASTLKISTEDFLAGRYRFTDGGMGGAVDNQGQIRAREGGYVALLGHQVNNAGAISAPGGSVALAAGERITLDLHGDGLLGLRVDAAAAQAKLSHSGSIDAAGGTVILAAHAKNAMVDTVLNVQGTVRATGISQRNGEIYLDGGDSGTVEVSAELDTSGHASQADAGSHHGGTISVTGEHVALTGNARLDASGDEGGGEIRIGGGRQGEPLSLTASSDATPVPLATAKTVNVAAGASLDASATGNGQGGSVVMWAEEETRFAGSAKAGGGTQGGDGGFVETSAHRVQIEPEAKVSTLAPKGKTGDWLLDPDDWIIGPLSSGGDETGAHLSASLATTNRTIQTTLAGTGGQGDIYVNEPVTWSAEQKLSLVAINNIIINADITATGNTPNAGLVLNYGLTPAAGYFLNSGAKITLSGTSPTLKIGTTGSLVSYTVINSLGSPGSTTGTDLQGMAGNLSGFYALGSDIDATATSGWNGGAGFAPVGNASSAFTGILDGLGHSIGHLSINRPATDGVGLFGYTQSAKLTNLSLTDTNISGRISVGGLAGELHGSVLNHVSSVGKVSGSSQVGGLVGYADGTITNAYAEGSVTGTDAVGGLAGRTQAATVRFSSSQGSVTGVTRSGGLVGANYSSNILDSYSSANVSGADSYAGGLVADNYFSTIVRSHASGNVSNSGDTTGGLVGYNHNSDITDSYATGSVTGRAEVGGLIGVGGTESTNKAINSYATGHVSGTSRVGGLAGITTLTDFINSYWDSGTTGQTVAIGAFNNTTLTNVADINAHPYAQSSYSGFDFSSTWWMADGGTRPFLRSEYSTSISNAHQLQLMATDLSARYSLANNIYLAELQSASGLWNPATGFVPVGSPGSGFSGSLDGGGHTITGLNINRPTADNMGLFGSTTAASHILNIGLLGGSVTGQGMVGALAGQNLGEISFAYATTAVSGTSQNGAGGLVGWNEGPITDSYATGKVTGRSAFTIGNFGVGGLVGENSGPILRSYASGQVSGVSNSVGGLLGANHSSVTNSYATGDVEGANSVGGLVGFYVGTGITDSYSTGKVTGASFTGGLIGRFFGGTPITHSFWNTQTSGQVGSAGGSGLDTSAMQTRSTYINAGWDMTNTWGIVDGASYPYLLWQYAAPPQILSGTLIGLLNVNGQTIQTAVNGTPFASAITDAHGFFSLTLPQGSIADGVNLLAYLVGGGSGPAATVRLSDGNSLTGLNLAPSLLSLASNGSTPVSITNLLSAEGGLSTSDIPYTVTSGNLILSPGTAFQTGIGTVFILNGDISTSNAAQSYNGPVSLTRNATLSSGNGDIQFNNGPVNGSAFELTLISSGTVSQAAASPLGVASLALRGAGGTFQLDSANNAIGTLAAQTGSLAFKDNSGFNIGSVGATAGITVTGYLSLESTATVTQTEAITANGLELTGNGGRYEFNLVDNAITTLAGNTGTVLFHDNTGFAIGTVDTSAGLTATNTVSLSSAASVSQSAAITAPNLELLGIGGIFRLDAANNNIKTLAADTGSVAVKDNTGFAIGTVNTTAGLTASSDVTLFTPSGVSQTQAIKARGLELLGALGNFDLSGADNAVTTLAADASRLAFNDNGGFKIGTVNTTAGVNVNGNVILNSTGTVTQTQAIRSNILTLGGAGGTFQLDTADNSTTVLESVTGTVRFKDNSGFSLGGTNTANLSLTSTGTVTATEGIAASRLELLGQGGSFELGVFSNNVATLAADTGSLRFRGNSGFDIGSVNATHGLSLSGDASLNSFASVTQSQAITASGLELLNGSFTLDNPLNHVGNLAAQGLSGPLRYTNRDALAIGAAGGSTGISTGGNDVILNAGGTLTVNARLDAGGGRVEINSLGNIDGGPGGVIVSSNPNAGVTLQATGGIGILGEIRTDLGGSGGLFLQTGGAGAAGDIRLAEAGSLKTSQVSLVTGASQQTVSLSSDTSNMILDANLGNATDNLSLTARLGDIAGGGGTAKANNLTLAAGGGIGTVSPVHTDTPGILSLSTAGVGAAGNIAVAEANALDTGRVSLRTDPNSTQTVSLSSAGPISLNGDIGNPADNLSLTASQGGILGGAGTAYANRLQLLAQTGIGSELAPLRTAAAIISAVNVANGAVVISNTGNAQVAADTGGGGFTLNLDAGSLLTVGLNGIHSQGGAIKLSADGMAVNGAVNAGGGLITLAPVKLANTEISVGGSQADGPGLLAIDATEAGQFVGTGGLTISNPQRGIQFSGAAPFAHLAGGKLTFNAGAAITRLNSTTDPVSATASTKIVLQAQTGIGEADRPVLLDTQGASFSTSNRSGGVFVETTGNGTTVIGGNDGSQIDGDPNSPIAFKANGDILLQGAVGNGQQTISLTSATGGIFADTAGLVIAPNVSLQAQTGIGTANAPINTQASRFLNLNASSGGIFVSNLGSVSLAAPKLADDAPLSVSATGTLTLPVTPITAGSINLASQGGPLLVKTALTATNGTINLTGSQGISLANNLSSRNGNIKFQGAVSLPVDPIIDAGASDVSFSGPIDGAGAGTGAGTGTGIGTGTGTTLLDSFLVINTTGTVRFGGAIGSNVPLAYLAVNGGGPIFFAESLVRTLGSQTYEGPVTGTALRFESANGPITATNPLNQFIQSVSASGDTVMLAADQLNVGIDGITARQIALTANILTTEGTIQSTGTDPAETGLSLIGLSGNGQFGTATAPLSVDINNRLTVTPDSFSASTVFLSGPKNSTISFDQGLNHRLIDYNGSLLAAALNPNGGEILAVATATYSILPNSGKSANEAAMPKGSRKELATSTKDDQDEFPLRQTEIVAHGQKLPGETGKPGGREETTAEKQREDILAHGAESNGPSTPPPLEPFKLPVFAPPPPKGGDFNSRLLAQVDHWFTLNAATAIRPVLAERLESGYARENVRKKLAQGIVRETGAAAPALGDITDEGVKLANRQGCGGILLASWSVSANCQ